MTTTSALVGNTGFVGANLAAQHRFEDCFNSKDIEGIVGKTFDLLVVSAMPGTMWIANKDPVSDRASLDRLVGCLQSVQATQVVIMSTVAVYPVPVGVDEHSAIDPAIQLPYGRHRLMLEQSIAQRFPSVLAVRLPALFGNGLKKNAVYDLLNDYEVDKINPKSVYQFYNLDWLWRDTTTALGAGLRVVNFATQPVSIREVAREAFDLDLRNDPGTPAARFDMRTSHADLFGGRDGYLYDRRQVLNDLRDFVRRQRGTEPSP